MPQRKANWPASSFESEASFPPGFVRDPKYRASLRTGSVKAATAGNVSVVRYLCEERGVPVNYVPPDEVAWTKDLPYGTPLAAALARIREEVAFYLLSLPRKDSPPLDVDRSIGDHNRTPVLTAAAFTDMVRVARMLLGYGADLLARDREGHLAVCRAVQKCHVGVAKMCNNWKHTPFPGKKR